MICKDCKKNKPETEFNLTEGYRRNQCKSCTKKSASIYLNPESFYNADTLHMTLNIDDLKTASPDLFTQRGIIKKIC